MKKNNEKLYFAIKNIESNFSVYGNDVTWEGIIINDKGQVKNDYFSIKTCEMSSDFDEQIMEDDENHEIFDEDGEIINQAKYDEELQALEEMMTEYYYEQDCDYSENIELDGVSYVKISLKDFVDNHQIGEVGHFDRTEYTGDLTKREGIVELSRSYFVELGGWLQGAKLTFDDHIDVTSEEGRALFVKIASFIASELDNADTCSQCVNVRFGGDYDMEEEARNIVNYTYVEMAYVVIRSLLGKFNVSTINEGKRLLSLLIRNTCVRMGFAYWDTYDNAFDFEAGLIYDNIIYGRPTADAYVPDMKEIIDTLLENIYPMDDDEYEELLKDRKNLFLK